MPMVWCRFGKREVRMAGDYLPMRLDLDEDPAVIQMAATLELSELDVVGRLWKVWAWMNRQTRDGNAPGVTAAWLDRYAHTPGLSHAMEAAGWLELTESGVSVPAYDTWNSKAAKTRLQGAKRATTHREKKRKRNAPAVTKALPQDSTVEESKEEKRDDHKCSWKEKLVETSHLKDWCRETFGHIAAGRGAAQLSADEITRDMLLRVGVLRLCDAVSEAFVQDACEGLRKAERWPENPGGWLRTVWNESPHAPHNADAFWFDDLLHEVTLSDGI